MSDPASSAARQVIQEIRLWSEAQGWPLAPDRTDQLVVYLETLLAWNRSFALVSSRQDVRTIATKHFADSLAAAAHCREARSAVDLGSGAGFPGLVMAIANPESRVTLVESRGKKVSFLREVIRLTAVANADARQERIEASGQDSRLRGEFDIAISRAFGPLDDFLLLARALLREGGVAVAMKGPSYREELKAVRLDSLAYTFESAREYLLPDSSQRALLRFRRE